MIEDDLRYANGRKQMLIWFGNPVCVGLNTSFNYVQSAGGINYLIYLNIFVPGYFLTSYDSAVFYSNNLGHIVAERIWMQLSVENPLLIKSYSEFIEHLALEYLPSGILVDSPLVMYQHQHRESHDKVTIQSVLGSCIIVVLIPNNKFQRCIEEWMLQIEAKIMLCQEKITHNL